MKSGIKQYIEYIIITELCDKKRIYSKWNRDSLSLEVTLQDDNIAYVNVKNDKDEYLIVCDKKEDENKIEFDFQWYAKLNM